MESMNLMPVDTGSGFGTGGAAALGAFVGSWFGNGGFGGGFGRDGAAATVAGDVTLLQSINDLGLTVVQGQNQSNLVAAQGFAGLNTVVQTGDASVTAAITQSSFQNLNALTQGFAGLNTAIVSSSNDTRFAISDLARQNAECCCEIKGAIAAEGSATRGLIQQQYISQLQTELCDAKSKIGSLESNAYLAASQSAQTQQIISTVLAHLHVK